MRGYGVRRLFRRLIRRLFPRTIPRGRAGKKVVATRTSRRPEAAARRKSGLLYMSGQACPTSPILYRYQIDFNQWVHRLALKRPGASGLISGDAAGAQPLAARPALRLLPVATQLRNNIISHTVSLLLGRLVANPDAPERSANEGPMATGSALLAQLRARREGSGQSLLQPRKNSDNEAHTRPDSGFVTPGTPSEELKNHQGCSDGCSTSTITIDKSGEAIQCHQLDVEVCGAVDCAGEGSIACLIELEELFAEGSGCRGTTTVCRSPCLRACGSGPAVRVSYKSGSVNGNDAISTGSR